MSEVTNDSFENGVFWELYRDLERQFRNFLEYVPFLQGNENTYSFKLLNLILSIGGHVDSAFKEMAKSPYLSRRKGCKEIREIMKESERNIRQGKAPKIVGISLALKTFDTIYGISREKIIFKRLPEREFVQPFMPHNPKTRAPEWWEIYNGVKHNLPELLKEANLQNALSALAGAFLLNVRHIPAMIRLYDYGVLKVAWGDKVSGKKAVDEILREGFIEMIRNKSQVQRSAFFVETSTFLYNYGKG